MARPSRATVYARLDRAVDGLRDVGGLPTPAEARGIWKDIWHQEAHHSTAMEGNTLLLREVQLLLDEHKAVGSKEMTAYLEVQGYASAAEWVYAQAIRRSSPGSVADYQEITLSEVREIHKLVVDPAWLQFPPEQLDRKEGPGSFRRKNIEPFPGGMAPPDWTDIPPLASDWIVRANNHTAWPMDRHIMEDFADLHAAFERIHPFRDGNGRVGRLVLNLLLVRWGYPPAVIYKTDRDRYLRGLQRADASDPGLLGEILARAIKESIDRFVLPGLAGPHKMIPISALAGTEGLSHNALTLAAQRGKLQAIKRAGQWHSTKKAVEEYTQSKYKREQPPGHGDVVSGPQKDRTDTLF